MAAPLPAIRLPIPALDLRPAPFGTAPHHPRAQVDASNGEADELMRLMSGLKLPMPVASFAYPRGCRIQQVRLAAPKPA